MTYRNNFARLHALQRKALKQRLRFKTRTRYLNRFIRKRKAKSKRVRREYSSYQRTEPKRLLLKVPTIFSIGLKVEAVLLFIYSSKKAVERLNYKQIVFDFSNVNDIDDGAATILLSFCYDMNNKFIRVGVINLPNNDLAKEFLVRSGFIKYFDGPINKHKRNGINTTIKKGKSTILQKDSAVLVHQSMNTVWGEDRRNQKLQGMLIELMTNSVNHAYLNNTREKSWYLSTNHYLSENKVEFCFVDNGDGIINTINVKFKDRLFSTREDILMRAFNGEFRSRTMLANRGRGLGVVKNNHKNMTIKGLKVITNNVILDFDNMSAKKLTTPFSGTFYSWIIDQSCK